VIVERVLHLLRTIPELDGENILAVTYTRKAAAEMQARIRRLGDKRAERVGVHTFHDFCYKLLRTHDEALRILDKVDYWVFLRKRLDQLGLDLFKKLSAPGHFLSDFTEFFSRCQDELVGPEDYVDYVASLARAFEEQKGLLSEPERAERELDVRKQQELARAYAAPSGCWRRLGAPPSAARCLGGANCWNSAPTCARTTRNGSATSWWTNSRTPTSLKSVCWSC
jgi:superfamily I DNA/RNA helicase